jgi:hypothetical protein
MFSATNLFRFVALAFVCAALFHLSALLWPSIAEPVPPWRHALFVVINAALALGMRRRPRGFAFVFALFTAQQLWSHGVSGWQVWRDEQRVDWASLVTLLFLPGVLALLIREARAPRSPAP